MIGSVLAKLGLRRRDGRRPDRVSILIPFLIISAGLGVLAWRSYELSVKMEQSANTLAVQYAGYAAEIIARRVDAAVKNELTRATETWQQLERFTESPTDATVRRWVGKHEWVVSAIYVPDHDPANSVYVSELSSNDRGARLQREFFSSSGTVTYAYEPARLLAQVQKTMPRQPFIKAGDLRETITLQPADVLLVRSPKRAGLVRVEDGFAFFTPLASPMADYAIRAVVRTSYIGTGWENQRLVSLWASLVALALMAVGGFLAWRGLNREAETMGLRSALIANVSHELRTPLSMIRLGAETLKRGSRLQEKERQDIEDQILREVIHLSHLVENVLDVARVQHNGSKTLALVPVQPRELVASVVADYESWIRSKGFSVSIRADEEIESQMWDRDAVSRALLNLVDNAIKYSGEEKAIDVTVRPTPSHVAIEVRDRGIGIDARDVAKIFDPYYRAQFSDTQTRRGAGLGLTLVRQIVSSHGGRIEVESQPGVGSTFRMLFPRPTSEERVALAGLVQSKPVTS